MSVRQLPDIDLKMADRRKHTPPKKKLNPFEVKGNAKLKKEVAGRRVKGASRNMVHAKQQVQSIIFIFKKIS